MEQWHGEGPVTGQTAESVAVRGRRTPTVPVRSLLRVATAPRFVWSTGETTVVTAGGAVRLAADGPDRFESIRERAGSVLASVDAPGELPPAARPRLFGGFAFHEDHDGRADGPWQGFPGALFVLPTVQLTATPDGTWLTAAAVGTDAPDRAQSRLDRWARRLASTPTVASTGQPGVTAQQSTPDRAGWRAQVQTALDLVDHGELRKVVLAGSRQVDLGCEPVLCDVLSRLASSYPDCTRYLVDPGDGGAFFGATPERLVTVEDRSVEATVLAGSTGRGDTEAEDAWLAEDLRESEKDGHEHEVVLEAIRDRLAPLSTAVDAGDRRVRTLATVQHLETPVSATLDSDRHVLELVERLHPTPAVGGMPQDAALRTIRELEGFERGWYAAPVGWIDGDGNGTFVVALRSAVADDASATLFAGNGIVADSDPDREWDEVQLKYRPILDELS